jgi:hypothetical protein
VPAFPTLPCGNDLFSIQRRGATRNVDFRIEGGRDAWDEMLVTRPPSLIRAPKIQSSIYGFGRNYDHGVAALDSIYDVLSFYHLTEYGVLSVQVRLWRMRDEELATIGTRASVGH